MTSRLGLIERRLASLAGCAAALFVILALSVASGTAQPTEEAAQVVQDLMELAGRSAAPGLQMDVSDRAREIFQVGDKASSYEKMMTPFGFKMYVDRIQGRRVVAFTNEDVPVPPDNPASRMIGHLELRFIATTDEDDNIQSVIGKIFFHTL
jgi:hypothetical protein